MNYRFSFSLLSGNFFPQLLFRLYCFGLFLGGIYSVPPIRTKKNPLLAGLTIATVRGFLLNFGIYYAVKDAVGAAFQWSPKVSFIARFMTIFATVIAVTKDLPDIEGDKVWNCFFLASKEVKISGIVSYLFSSLSGFSNRDLCNKSWRETNCSRSVTLFVWELYTCHPYWRFVETWRIQYGPNDWWSYSIGSYVDYEV
jgi:hypothetical protein